MNVNVNVIARARARRPAAARSQSSFFECVAIQLRKRVAIVLPRRRRETCVAEGARGARK